MPLDVSVLDLHRFSVKVQHRQRSEHCIPCGYAKTPALVLEPPYDFNVDDITVGVLLESVSRAMGAEK